MNDVTLRELIDQRLADERRYYDKRFDEIADALLKANEANERRLGGLNEWRQQSKDREANWVGTEEFSTFRETWRISHDDLTKRVIQVTADSVGTDRFEALEKTVNISAGRRTTIAAGAGVLVAVVALLFTQLSRNIPTHQDIHAQIVTEAPWLLDKLAITHRLDILEKGQSVQNLAIQQIRSLDEFFCRTRTPNLPGC